MIPLDTVLEQVMKHCNNFFVRSKEAGDYEIVSGVISLQNSYITGQYLLVKGSVLHDGVYKVIDDKVTLKGASSELFRGRIYGLAVPSAFLELVEKIREAQGIDNSAYISESINGVWSGTRATDANGNIAGWQANFSASLKPYKVSMFAPDL